MVGSFFRRLPAASGLGARSVRCSTSMILAGLNEAQRQAARALRGPVAILAGAGTGKTTARSRTASCQVRGGVRALAILAVTFTDKAAGELRAWLAALGVEGVEARTFHSAALSQLSRLWSTHTGEPLPEVLDHKAPLISSLANALPPPHKFLPRRELAGEIEWAKNLDDHPGAIPERARRSRATDPGRVDAPRLRRHERRKRSTGRFDFEDMLGLALRLFDEHPDAAEQVRSTVRRVHGGRVPGRELLQAGLLNAGSATATSSAWSATTTRRSTRSPAHRPSTSSASRAGSRTRGSFVSGELPLHPRGAHARQPARDTPGRVPQVAPGGTRPRGRRRSRAPNPTRRPRSAPSSRPCGACTKRKPCRSRRSRPTWINAAPSRSRRRSPPRRSRTRCATARSRRPRRAVLQRLKRSSSRFGGRGRRGDHRPARLRPGSRSDADEEVTRETDSAACVPSLSEFERAGGGDAAAFCAELAVLTEHSGRGVNLLTYHRARGWSSAVASRGCSTASSISLGPGQGRPEEERRSCTSDHAHAGTSSSPGRRPPRAAEPVPRRDGARAVGASRPKALPVRRSRSAEAARCSTG